jgi:cyclic pyranopterin phosphate synthase
VVAGRRLNTVRISVGGACDLDCVYCDAAGGADAPSSLTADQVVRLAAAARLAGARTVRLTGGEPLLRGDLEEIIARIRADGPELDIALTTNAQRLAARAAGLRGAGLNRINIGMPSLEAQTYRRMTGGELAPAMAGLEKALAVGLSPVKLNVVVMRGVNDGEIERFVAFAASRPVEVRFIERMPFAGGDSFVPAAEIRDAVRSSVGPTRMGRPVRSPTAEVYAPAGFAGRLGLISPVSAPFCERCDRLRVTARARLRACLSEPDETDLRGLLEAGVGADRIADAMSREFARKPACHVGSFCGPMRTIGG